MKHDKFRCWHVKGFFPHGTFKIKSFYSLKLNKFNFQNRPYKKGKTRQNFGVSRLGGAPKQAPS